jgi:pentatricopeptide repeat protein
MELVIFGVTLTVAFVLNFAGGKRSLLDRRRGSGGKLGKSCAAAPGSEDGEKASKAPPSSVGGGGGSYPAAEGSTMARRRGSPPSAPGASTAPRSQASAQGWRASSNSAAGYSSGPARSASQIIDDVVDGMREQQSVKFAGRALTMYDELRATLAAQGNLSFKEAIRLSRHSAVDFYTTLVQCTVRVGRFHFVEVLIDDMTREGISRPLLFYESTMKQLAGQKQYELALAVYDCLAADGLEPSAVTCSCLIGFAAEVGELQRAVEFFDKLSSITTPSIRAYMTVLRVHAKRQDWPASLQTLRQMKGRGVNPDSLVLNFALATGIAADQVEAVGKLVEEAEAYKPPIADVVSYNTLIKGYAQRGDADGASEAIRRMRKSGLKPNAITFNTAMDANVRGGHAADAWDLLAEMRSMGLKPDKFTCSILVKSLAKAATAKQVQSVLDLLREVDAACDATLRSALYHAVLEAAAQVTTDGSLAAKTFAQMRKVRVVPTAAAQKLALQALPVSSNGNLNSSNTSPN